jgi:hypothetical protein
MNTTAVRKDDIGFQEKRVINNPIRTCGVQMNVFQIWCMLS